VRRHTSFTDLELTEVGESQARRIPGILAELGFSPDAVYSSPRKRAQQTAACAGYPEPTVVDDLAEWNYGAYEGRTMAQIQEDEPGWTFVDGSPQGETPNDVEQRVDRLLGQLRTRPENDVVLFTHGHLSRVLAVRWVSLPVRTAALLNMDAAHISVLSWHYGKPVLQSHNVPPVAVANQR
jgi:broad specificity phosphatase PhoE